MCSRYSIFLMMFFISFQSTADKDSPSSYNDIIGNYTYTQKGDELIDGKNASITWVLNFLPERKVKVSITSWHAPFTCDGLYQVVRNSDEIKLTWQGGEGSEMECNTSAPQIVIKKNPDDVFLIKS